MKTQSLIRVVAFFVAVSMVVITGCEYDVTQPQWEQGYQAPPTPRITQIEPDNTARPGVNTITLRGENFAATADENDVYFGIVAAEIVANSATAITVRRPNLVTDSCTVKVVSNNALVVAKYDRPYKIEPVVGRYGSFLDNLALSVVAIDNAENLYAVEAASRNIVKVTPDGQKTSLGVAARVPTDVRIGPGGKLYMPGNNRSIEVFDPQTGLGKDWRRCPSGKIVRYGDFDANGYFYTGGLRSDLVIIAPDSTFRSAGVYTGASEILAVRVYNGYVYVAARAASPVSIWRHSIDANGNLGPQELVLDMSVTAFSSRLVKSLTFSSNGTMYIATDSADPILIADPTAGSADILYKGILPSNCKHFYWGIGNYLYMIRGDTALGQEWTIFRIDMGTTGAPYFGR